MFCYFSFIISGLIMFAVCRTFLYWLLLNVMKKEKVVLYRAEFQTRLWCWNVRIFKIKFVHSFYNSFCLSLSRSLYFFLSLLPNVLYKEFLAVSAAHLWNTLSTIITVENYSSSVNFKIFCNTCLTLITCLT